MTRFSHKLRVDEFSPQVFNIVENEAIIIEKVQWRALKASRELYQILCAA